MQKLIIICALFGLLQLAMATPMKCDLTDKSNCMMTDIVTRLDNGVKDAHITMVKKIVRNHIDVLREVRKKCAEEKAECMEAIDRDIEHLKKDLAKLDENLLDEKEQLKTVMDLLSSIKKETLNAAIDDNEIKKMSEEQELEVALNDAVNDCMEEIVWLMKEALIEVKQRDVKMDDKEQKIADWEAAMMKMERQNTKRDEIDAEKAREIVETLKKMSDAVEMNWTKGMDMDMGMEKIKNIRMLI